MSTENTGQSPFNRWWFIAGGIVLLVVIALILLLTGVIGGGGVAAPIPTSSQQQPTPSTSGEPTQTQAPNADGCTIPAGDQSIPTAGPPASWETDIYVLYPTSGNYGPTSNPTSNVWGCFTHSPTGALFAAANGLVGLLGQNYAQFAQEASFPQGREAWLASQADVSHEQEPGRVAQIAGFQFLSIDESQALISLGAAQGDVTASVLIALIWDTTSNNWKIDLSATDVVPVSADLNAYTPWSATSG